MLIHEVEQSHSRSFSSWCKYRPAAVSHRKQKNRTRLLQFYP